MWLCTTIITNIMWFPHVFAGRPRLRGPVSMLAGLWQHKLRDIWWLIKWQSNTCMNYEIAAWMELVSSPRWMEMKEMKCNFFLFNYTISGPGTQKPIHPIVIHENEISGRDRDRSISFRISPVRLTLIQFAPQFCSLCVHESENDFWFQWEAKIISPSASPYGHDGMTQQQRVKCDKHAMWFERTTLPTCCCLFRAVFLCGGT